MRLGADGGSVDVHDAGLEIALRAEGIVDVARVNRRGEAVDYAVGDGNGVVKRVERNHGYHRAEDFFLADAHLRFAIGEDGRLVEPSSRVRSALQTMPAGCQFCPVVLADLDILHY